ncbi:DUF2232 domain-containing protein [Hansschlegelia plantiphila]|uniref:Membrane protein n=1 Tax=Hansschlegelia plantiphila TaxID=374655 RepID=A0A9W6IYM9_9HYPH|nr:DUF2232 domain-containing protein [Hansschlegelia plantiphila]GLK67590.1 membrane protein [Hansschlegelia plantiphila]
MPAAYILVGIGAGAASALLYAAAASGSPLALTLLYVAPLPILLAAVGWRHSAGLIATAVGAGLLLLSVGPKTGLYFVIAVGLPSWWLGYLALLARPGVDGRQPEWYPIGRLTLWCAALGALLVAASIPLIATSLEDYRAALRTLFEKAFETPGSADGGAILPRGQDPKALIELMTALAPGMAASFWTLASIFNLWLAGRITRASGRLARPWPDIRAMEFPRAAALGLAVAVALSFLPNLAGLVAELFAGTFLVAFTLLGLCVVHVATLRTPMRVFILFGFYTLLVLQPWIAVLLSLLGLAEQFVGLRRRFGPPPGGPPTAAANLP